MQSRKKVSIIVLSFLITFSSTIAQLKVAGRFLQDANHVNAMLRGVNVDIFKEGYINDIATVSNAVASTKANVVRLAWWTHNPSSPEPQTGTTYNTPTDLDNAITAYANKGILSIVMLHDLTGKDDTTQFQNIITSYWTSAAVVAVINKHKDHMVLNIANEWGPNYNTNGGTDSQTDIVYYINNYKTAIAALRKAGITVPLMIDADQYGDNEKIFINKTYSAGITNGQYLINQDPLQNLLFSIHTYYWDYTGNNQSSRLNAVMNSGLPIVIGEEGNLLPDGNTVTLYSDLLTKANTDSIGYVAWSWYNDGTGDNTGTSPFWMNMTIGTTNNGSPGGTGNGTTIPTSASQNTWGYNMLNAAGYGINATNTLKIPFIATVLPVTLTSFTAIKKDGYNLLNWQTATEINARSFVIEYSFDGIDFKSTGNIPATNALAYNFKDMDNTLAAVVFYRLKMVDMNGSFTYSNVILLDNKTSTSNSLQLSPNPTKGLIKVNVLDNLLVGTQAELIDANGKKLQQFKLTNPIFQIDLSIYNKGLYFFKLLNGKLFKIIKE